VDDTDPDRQAHHDLEIVDIQQMQLSRQTVRPGCETEIAADQDTPNHGCADQRRGQDAQTSAERAAADLAPIGQQQDT